MQFKVPQNIDLEDKIIGPLTLKQFLYLIVGGMIIYVSMEAFSTPVFLLISVPTALLCLSLTFLKIQDQPFSHFLLSLVMYFRKPRKRIWQKKIEYEQIHSIEEKKSVDKEKDKKVYKEKTLSEVNLDELSYVLDVRGLKENTNEPNINNKDKNAAIYPQKN